jgi:hypothetical protein
MDVIIFPVGRAPCSEMGDRTPTDNKYWADKGWLEKRRRYYVDVPVNPL